MKKITKRNYRINSKNISDSKEKVTVPYIIIIDNQILLKGALDQVKIFRDPNVAAQQCKTDLKVSINCD